MENFMLNLWAALTSDGNGVHFPFCLFVLNRWYSCLANSLIDSFSSISIRAVNIHHSLTQSTQGDTTASSGFLKNTVWDFCPILCTRVMPECEGRKCSIVSPSWELFRGYACLQSAPCTLHPLSIIRQYCNCWRNRCTVRTCTTIWRCLSALVIVRWDDGILLILWLQ